MCFVHHSDGKIFHIIRHRQQNLNLGQILSNACPFNQSGMCIMIHVPTFVLIPQTTCFQQHHSVCKDMVLLAANVLVTAKEDNLILYDIREGKRIGTVNLSTSTTTSVPSSPSTRMVNNSANVTSSSPLLSSPSPTASSSASNQGHNQHLLLNQGKCYIKNLKVSTQNRAVVCDLGSQICVIHLTEKYD